MYKVKEKHKTVRKGWKCQTPHVQRPRSPTTSNLLGIFFPLPADLLAIQQKQETRMTRIFQNCFRKIGVIGKISCRRWHLEKQEIPWIIIYITFIQLEFYHTFRALLLLHSLILAVSKLDFIHLVNEGFSSKVFRLFLLVKDHRKREQKNGALDHMQTYIPLYKKNNK